MSIDTSAKLIVGLMGNAFDDDMLDHMLNEGDVASYHYDANPIECIVGYTVIKSYGDAEIDFEALAPKIKHCKDKFLLETGLEAKLYLSPHVS
jgi:hypothetical protein